MIVEVSGVALPGFGEQMPACAGRRLSILTREGGHSPWKARGFSPAKAPHDDVNAFMQQRQAKPMNSHIRQRLCAAAFLLLAFGTPLRAQSPSPYVAGKDYAARAAATCRLFAVTIPDRPNFPKDAMPLYAARLQTGTDVDGTLQSVDKMMDATLNAKLDPFNLHAIMNAYCLTPDRYPAPLRAKFHAFAARWDYTKDIGVSLNYGLMRDGAGWLAAQEWPDLRDTAGHDAAQIQALCGARLMSQFRETTARNASEYEAPLYYGTDLMAVRMLAEFAREPRMQRAAQLTLEWMLIQTAAYWHHGYYVTSSGRAKYWGSNNLSPDAPGATTGMAYLLFGGERPARLDRVPQIYWLAYPGRTVPGDWLPAWQAALPETRAVQGSLVWPSHHIFVRKQAWMTTGYGLASERTDGTSAGSYQYKESRRTMLKWVSARPDSTFTIIQDNRRRPREKIANAFAYGENPYCQVMQAQGTLIGVYDVPDDYGFSRVHAPFTNSGAIILRQERDGWVLCHGGSVLFAFRFLQPARWGKPDARDHLDLYESDSPRGGWILETSPLAPFAGGGPAAELARFADALAKTKITGDVTVSPPRVTFTDIADHTLDLRWHPPGEAYAGQCQLDGKPVAYGSYPLLATPGVRQEIGGPLTIALPGGRRRVYDFSQWKVTESGP